mgnify:CR=1 FL=1
MAAMSFGEVTFVEGMGGCVVVVASDAGGSAVCSM